MLVYNGQIPGPTIAVCEGDDVVVNLTNKLTGSEYLLGAPWTENGQGITYLLSDIPFNSTTLHFHGIREKQPPGSGGSSPGGPWSDGVPMVSQCPVLSGDSFTYRFLGSGGISSAYNNAPAGTYWYHSHMGRQRTNGAEGKLIIMPRTTSNKYDVDLPENSLFLQEWYSDTVDGTPQSILVNGKGKLHKTTTKILCEGGNNCETKYKEGKFVEFETVSNPYYRENNQPDYEVFNITEPGKYRFRIIGGIGDNVPIRVSVENHTFSAIAADSVDIKPLEDLDALWVSAGERFDIVVDLLPTTGSEPLKMNIFHGTTSQAGAKITICSLAWLKYPHQP